MEVKFQSFHFTKKVMVVKKQACNSIWCEITPRKKNHHLSASSANMAVIWPSKIR